jgi:hypothetical protein
MEKVPSALDLFKLYHNHYPVIEMMPLHLGGITEAGRLYLLPSRNGHPISSRHRIALWKYPYLDVAEAGIRSRTDFDPAKGTTPQVQQQAALWKKISEEYFAKRRFTMHLGYLPGYYSLNVREHPMFPVRFRVWRRMRGLHLDPKPTEPAAYVHWSAFIPEGTPEWKAVQAALDLAHIVHEKPTKPSQADVKKYQDIVREKIAAVPA